MGKFEIVQRYKNNGFIPFPLRYMSKEPLPGMPLYMAPKVSFEENDNVGLFTGSKNGLAVIDADNPETAEEITRRFRSTGWYDWITIVKTPRRGLHFWIRVADVPEYAQAYYHIVKHVGKGEVRVKWPAYVAAPGSVLQEGEYEFVRGGIEFFSQQPVFRWIDLVWVLPTHAYSANGHMQRGGVVMENPLSFPRRDNPYVLKYFELLREASPGEPVRRIDLRTGNIMRKHPHPSRSEAEAALVTGLILAGWSFEEIEDCFESESTGHYKHAKNPGRYLVNTYNKALSFIIQNNEKKEKAPA